MFDRLSVIPEPFPRLAGQNVLDEYSDLLETWPSDLVAECALRDKSGMGFSPLARMRKDELARLRPRLPLQWLKWLDRIHGERFSRSAHRFFDTLVHDVYGRTFDFEIRAQLVECTARSEPHRVIGPHIDTEATLWVVEIFFPHPSDDDQSGGFDFFQWKGAEDWRGSTVKANPEAVEMIQSAPYVPNSAAGFVNSIRSLHASGLRNASAYPRRYVSISGHTKEILFTRR